MAVDFLPAEIIRKKRDRYGLSEDEIKFFVSGLTDESISEAQVAAFAMAVYFQGMKLEETVALTQAMRDSGRVIDWRKLKIDGPIIDKHSTGGVGDKVSLILAPLLAACGGIVPMISGRGLGHTGGTLDKLDSILGYNTQCDLKSFTNLISKVGCGITGQSPELAPADGRLYAIRDVTATVESLPLITASILSKKLAAGLDNLIMDIKVGSGAFAREMSTANNLAKSIVTVANAANLPCSAVITDMNQVLGRTAGNAVEVREAIEHLTLKGRDDRLMEVTITLCRKLMVDSGLSKNTEDAKKLLEDSLSSGSAAEKFALMVSEMGGPNNFVDDYDSYLPIAPVKYPATPEHAGFIQTLDTRRLGLVVTGLGGGRKIATSPVDYAVGLTDIASIGEEVDKARPICTIHARNNEEALKAAEMIRSATIIGGKPLTTKTAIYQHVTC